MSKSEKIGRIVSVSPAFSEEVALKDDYNNAELNREKLRGYVPNKSSRDALKEIFAGLHPTSTQRVHLITGSYGTGKSHLALVLANLVSRRVDDADLDPLFTKIRKKDESLYHSIYRQCKICKKFLVVLPEPHWDPEGFDHSLRVAVTEALKREAIRFRPPSNFSAAIKQIEDWRDENDEAYEKLERALLRRGESVQIVLDRLHKSSDEAYNVFRQAYSEVAYGAVFQPEVTADPKKIYQETIRFLRDTGEWQGIFVLYDEFGSYLREMAKDPNSLEGQSVQEFAEYCKRSAENQCHLVVIAHQTLKDYAVGYRSEKEWEKIYGRFIRGEYGLTTLSEENEMENMIDSIVNQKGEGEGEKLLNRVYEHSAMIIAADMVRDRDLYPKQDVQWVRSVLLRGCYPLHPYATFCLPWLAEKVGQSHRTLFTFFDDRSEGGLRKYVDSTNVFTEDDHLSFYTADFLIRYFSSAAKAHLDYKHIMLARDEAVAICGAHKLSARIVDLITVLEIVGHPRLPPTKEIVVEALNVPSQKAHEVEQLLAELVQKKVLRLRRATKRYELPYRKGEVDAKEEVNNLKETVRESFNLVDVLNSKYALSPIEARQYAEKHFLTRKAVGEFVFPTHLSNVQAYLERVDKWYEPDRGSYEGDVLILYVVAESDIDITTAKSYLEDEARQHPQLVVAVPKKKVNFGEAVLEVEAARRLKGQGLATERGSVDPEDLDLVLEDAESMVRDGLGDFLRADNFVCYCAGNITTVKRGGEESYISQLLEHVFPKTPTVRDIAIMEPLSGRSTKGGRDGREAMAILLGVKGPFPIRKSGGGAVDRILRACLKNTELLEKVSDKGPIEEFQVRKGPPRGTELAEIWQLLQRTVVDPKGKAVEMGKLVRRLLAPPYGLSHQLIEILLAAFIRNVKDECVIFGNHLEVMRTGNPDHYVQVPITAESLARIVRSPDDLVALYYEVSEVEKRYITTIIANVDPEGEFSADIGLWENGKNSLLGWFGTLPKITTSASDFQQPGSKAVVELLSDQNRIQSAKDLFKQHLPQALRVEVSDPLLDSDCNRLFAAFMPCFEELNNYANSQELLLLSRLAEVFEADGRLQGDVSKAIGKWYNETLTEPQRLHTFSGDGGHLKRVAEKDGSIVDRFLMDLPALMGMGAYTDWVAPQSFELFTAKVKLAKTAVEDWIAPPPGGAASSLEERTAAALAQMRVLIRDIFEELNIPLEKQREILRELLEEITK